MSWSSVTRLVSATPPKLDQSSTLYTSSSSSSVSSVRVSLSSSWKTGPLSTITYLSSSLASPSSKKQICRAAAEYRFPDPIPDFADAVSLFFTHPVLFFSKESNFIENCWFLGLGDRKVQDLSPE